MKCLIDELNAILSAKKTNGLVSPTRSRLLILALLPLFGAVATAAAADPGKLDNRELTAKVRELEQKFARLEDAARPIARQRDVVRSVTLTSRSMMIDGDPGAGETQYEGRFRPMLTTAEGNLYTIDCNQVYAGLYFNGTVTVTDVKHRRLADLQFAINTTQDRTKHPAGAYLDSYICSDVKRRVTQGFIRKGDDLSFKLLGETRITLEYDEKGYVIGIREHY